MELLDWFEKGLSSTEYLSRMETNHENVAYIFRHFRLPTEEGEFIEKLQGEELQVLVLTEDWCGDAMLNVPVLLRLAEQCDIEVRFLYRDENLELMDQYLTNGTSRSIPIFIFMKKDGEEVVAWGPRAVAVQQIVHENRSGLPPKDHPKFEEKQKQVIQSLQKMYLEDKNLWKEVYQSMKSAIAEKIYHG